MKAMQNFFTLTFIFICFFSFKEISWSKNEDFITTESGKKLYHPQYVTTENGKIVVVHDQGISYLPLSSELVKKFNISSKTNKKLNVEVEKKAEKWLEEVKQFQSQVAAKKAAAEEKEREKEKVKAKEEQEEKISQARTAYTADSLRKEYDPKIHDGKYLSISGKISKMEKLGGIRYAVYLDDFVVKRFIFEGKVRSYDTLGNPKKIGTYKVGDTLAFEGSCLGINSDGHLEIQ